MGIAGKPQYNYGDRVRFKFNDDVVFEGTIEIIDSFGCFEYYMQQPSYDVLGKDKDENGTLTLFKHIPESDIIERI